MRETSFLMLAVVLAMTGCRSKDSSPASGVAATNSYLEAAVRDVLGEDRPVLRLSGPGMCPGHFDVRPSQIEALRGCRLLLRFDFQKSMDSKLAKLRGDGFSIVEVCPTGGLCEPSTYVATCRQVAQALASRDLADRSLADARLAEITRRVGRTASRCRSRISAAGLAGAPVVASRHQEAFCRWLGLEVVGSYRGADVESPKQLSQVVRAAKGAGAKLVIANLPEGTRSAETIAAHLGGAVVVFDNFPAVSAGRMSFDGLVATNVARLVEAAGS